MPPNLQDSVPVGAHVASAEKRVSAHPQPAVPNSSQSPNVSPARPRMLASARTVSFVTNELSELVKVLTSGPTRVEKFTSAPLTSASTPSRNARDTCQLNPA